MPSGVGFIAAKIDHGQEVPRLSPGCPLTKVISGYERRNLAGTISKNRHFRLAEVRAKREGKGPWGAGRPKFANRPPSFPPGAPRDLNHPSESKLPVFGNSFPSSYHGTFLGTGWYWPVSKLNGVLKCEVAEILLC